MDERANLAVRLQEILKNDYQITTNEELSEAIDKIGRIDISVFCSPIVKTGEGF